MKSKLLKITSCVISLSLSISLIAGCSKTPGGTTETTTAAKTTTTAGTEPKEAAPVYPIKTDVKLTHWSELNGNVSSQVTNLGDTPFAKEMEKRTGVKVEYIHASQGSEKDSFNILVASGDLPDIVEYDWYRFPGGPEMAIQNGSILKLNDVIEKYAPNLKKYLQENPESDKMAKTDSGSYYVFPFFRGDPMLMVYNGPVIRTDWLKELGLPLPETMDDWYVTLKAFKEKKGAEAPLSFGGLATTSFWMLKNGPFIGAFGVKRDFYQENGVIKYGPIESGYKDFLATMRKWYAEGLLDKNFASIDSKALDAQILAGKTAATVGNTGGGLGKWIPALQELDPNFDMGPAKLPTLNKGQRAKFGQRDTALSIGNGLSAISAKSKNAEIAAKWLDYGYGEEGGMLFNFGVEGKTYNMENGYPKFTEFITKNPEKLSMNAALSQYAKSTYGGAFIQRKEYMEQYLQRPQQIESLNLWTQSDAEKYMLPLITPTPEESTEMAKIMNEVDTYVNQFMLKVIMDAEPLENFDKYVEQLKKLGIEKAIAINQAALDRYNKR